MSVAPTVGLALEQGPARGRVLEARTLDVRWRVGDAGIVPHAVVLVAIEGEERPRWVDASRVVRAAEVEA